MTTKTKDKPTFTTESIQERIDELVEQRDTFIAEANQRIAMMNGAIQGLDSLLSANGNEPDETTKSKTG
jgi:predicted dinucleotide-utilizing enzyme